MGDEGLTLEYFTSDFAQIHHQGVGSVVPLLPKAVMEEEIGSRPAGLLAGHEGRMSRIDRDGHGF